MKFSAAKTAIEKLIDESSDEEESKMKPVTTALSADNGDEYKPLSNLKSVVKLRIFELAQ